MNQPSTFQTRSQDVQNVGIGNIALDTSKDINSDAAYIEMGASFVGNQVDKFAERETERISQQIVDDSLKGLEETRAASEESFGLDEPAVVGVANAAKKADRSIKQGTMTRENARLLVSNSVVKAIEEQPWLSRQIRKAASNLLGFDPKSEGTRQYFQSYATEAQLAAKASARKPTDYEKQVQNLMSTRLYSLEEAQRIAGELTRTAADVAILDNKLKIGAVANEDAFREMQVIDERMANLEIMNAVAERTSQEDFSLNLWKEEVSAFEQASWETIQAKLSASETPPNAKQMAAFKAEHTAKYDTIRARGENIGPENLTKEGILRMQLQNEAQAYVSMPVMMAIKDSLGERNVNESLALMNAAGDDPAKQQALIKMNPILGGFFEVFKKDRGQASALILNVLNKVSDPSSTLRDMTPEDEAVLDGIITPAIEKGSDEDHSMFTELLYSTGLKKRSLTSVLKKGRTKATPKQVKTVVNMWNGVKGTAISKVVPEIDNYLDDATKGTPRFELERDTKSGNLRIVALQGKNLDGSRRIIEGTEIANTLADLNRFLNAAGKGWDNDFGINNHIKEANAWVADLNDSVRHRELTRRKRLLEEQKIEETKARLRREDKSWTGD